jgi:hypothetical protein
MMLLFEHTNNDEHLTPTTAAHALSVASMGPVLATAASTKLH